MQQDAQGIIEMGSRKQRGWIGRRGGWLAGLALCAVALGGCRATPSGTFRLGFGPGEEPSRQIKVDGAWCVTDERDQVEAVAVSRIGGGEGADERILILRTFWRTRAARAPDPQGATNANVEYIVRQGGRTAWYRGAGYLEAERLNEEGDFELELLSAQVRLYGADEGFEPPFIEANLTGEAEARGSEAEVGRVLERFREYTEPLRN